MLGHHKYGGLGCRTRKKLPGRVRQVLKGWAASLRLIFSPFGFDVASSKCIQIEFVKAAGLGRGLANRGLANIDSNAQPSLSYQENRDNSG